MLAAVALAAALASPLQQPGWHTFAPEGKTFRVEMPRRPTGTTSRPVTYGAHRSRLTAAELEAPDAVYSIRVTENGGRVDPKTLDDGIRRWAAEAGGTLGTLAPIEVGGNPGRDFTMIMRSAGVDTYSKRRWVVAGDMLVMLAASGRPGGPPPGDADRFLRTLAFGPPNPPPAPATAPAPAPAAPKPEAPGAAEADEDAASRKVATIRPPRSARPYPPEGLEDLGRPAGGGDGDGFRDVGPSGSALVGVRVSYVERFGGMKVGAIQPIFRSGKDHYEGQVHGQAGGRVRTFVARPGYAVGGVVTHAGLMLDGFRLVFMKVDGDRLDPADSYESPWIGDERGGTPGEAASKGRLVVGLHGRAGNEVNALGLTAVK